MGDCYASASVRQCAFHIKALNSCLVDATVKLHYARLSPGPLRTGMDVLPLGSLARSMEGAGYLVHFLNTGVYREY